MHGHRVHALLAPAGAGLPVIGYITYKISFKLANHSYVQVAPKLQIHIEINVHSHCFDNPKINYRSTKRNNDSIFTKGPAHTVSMYGKKFN